MTNSELTQKLMGVVALMLTPFNEDGGIDWETYAHYTEWQAAKEPSGLFAVCGSSEMKWLTRDERLQLVKQTVQYAGDLPVIATGNLDPDPAKHPDEARQIEDAGASAVVLIPAPTMSGEPDRYYDYLLNMSQQVSCPVYVYEWPQVPNYLMDNDVFTRLAENKVIAGIKDTTCTVEGIQAKQNVAKDAVVYQANTAYLMEALDMGAKGIMAVTSAAKADLVKAFWDAYQTDRDTAIKLHRELVFLDMLLRPAYPATAKYIAGLQGMAMSTYTRWDVRLTAETCRSIDAWYEQLEHVLSDSRKKIQND